MVKAKFYVANVRIDAIDEHGDPRYGGVVMQAVSRGAANKRWSSATPVGKFEMNVNSSALGWFARRVGKELAITLDDASNDPQTHEYVPLEEEYQGSYRDESCAECGYPREAHA